MEKILRIPFTEIDTADLLVDAVYEGGTAKNLGSEVLSKVMHVGNSGGFRKCMKLGENGKKAKDVAYVCIYTTGEEIEWRDEIDRTLGRFTYWGDNRKAGNPMIKTNNFHIRHNNADTQSPKFKEPIGALSKEQLEFWYDEVYQMCLLAVLRLEHVGRKKTFEALKSEIESKTP